jgi:hypothetical protein
MGIECLVEEALMEALYLTVPITASNIISTSGKFGGGVNDAGIKYIGSSIK